MPSIHGVFASSGWFWGHDKLAAVSLWPWLMPVYTIGCPKPRLGVSENGVYGLSPFKWQRINEERDHNPKDLGVHYFQANHEKYHEIYHQFNMWQPQKRLPTSTVYCK